MQDQNEHLPNCCFVPGDNEFQELAMKKYGVSPTPSVFHRLLMKIVIPAVGFILDTFFLHAGWSLSRHRLFFSDEDLALLKEEATPKEVPANMDNWVTLSRRLENSGHVGKKTG